jgi:transcriptional regulator with XRE-family HTH domain
VYMYLLTPVPKCLSGARRRLHMSYQQVAEGICSREMIISYEKGTMLPSEEIAIKLANRLHLSPEALVMALQDDLELQEHGRLLRDLNKRFFKMMHHRHETR